METYLRGGVRILMAAAISLSWGSLAFGQDSDPYADERNENIVAMMTKLLCSGIFVIGREADEFIENDLKRTEVNLPGWDKLDVAIDWEHKTVTLTLEGYPSRKAVYTGDQGCTLLPRGVHEVSFKPVELRSALPDQATVLWPMGDKPSQQKVPAKTRKKLKRALDFAFDDSQHKIPQYTRAMVVVHKGVIIGERYAPGFDPDTRHISWSMGKSITAALMGILVGQGHFAVHDPAPVEAWRKAGDPRGPIRMSDLFHMSSGLRFHTGGLGDGSIFTKKDNHRFVYFGAPHVFDYSVNNEVEFAPNTVWRYRNCDPLALGKIIRDTVEKRGEDYLSFPQRALFDKIGMRHMVLETDPYGNFIMTGFDYGTARDWARFGLLHLQDGVWAGERILPEGWVDFIRTPAPAAKGRQYGGLFWLNKGKRYKTLPEDMFWPAGHHGQVVLIIPSRDIVIVRLGHSYRGGFDRYIEEVVGRILDSVKTAS